VSSIEFTVWIGREFVKHLRLLLGRSEIIRTRFQLNEQGKLVEHVSLETHDRLPDAMKPLRKTPSTRPAD
jgi:hypothetical protein